MDTIAKICIAAAVIICALIVICAAFKIKKAVESTLVLRNGKRDESIVWRLLKINYPALRIMRRVILPYNLSRDSKLFKIDAININHGGVLLITVKNFHGMIEDPFHGDWRQFYGQAITRLHNPLEQNLQYSNALKAQFRSMELINIPVQSLVVYLDPKTRFKNRIEQLLLVDRLTTYIHDMDKNRFLSKQEINKVIIAIRKCSRHPSKSQLQTSLFSGMDTSASTMSRPDARQKSDGRG